MEKKQPISKDYKNIYDAKRAYWMMQLSYAVYFAEGKDKVPDKEKILTYLQQKDQGFEELDGFSNKSTQSMVIAHKNYLALVFRGTDELADWLDNINALSIKKMFGIFHRGFYLAVMDVWREMEASVKKYQSIKQRPIWFSGHSLGGAMATIAAADYIDQGKDFSGIYTFGQPRCMSRKTAKKFDEGTNDRYFRFQNNNDIITKIPSAFLGYYHGGKAIYISEKKTLHYSPSRWFKFLDSLNGMLKAYKIKRFDQLQDHNCQDYLTAIEEWGDREPLWD